MPVQLSPDRSATRSVTQYVKRCVDALRAELVVPPDGPVWTWRFRVGPAWVRVVDLVVPGSAVQGWTYNPYAGWLYTTAAGVAFGDNDGVRYGRYRWELLFDDEPRPRPRLFAVTASTLIEQLRPSYAVRETRNRARATEEVARALS